MKEEIHSGRFTLLIFSLLILLAGLTIFAVRSLHATPVTPAGYVYVSKVEDGDTIEVAISGRRERVRLIGVDTPETVDPHRPVQCFGPQASQHTKAALTHHAVRLVADQGRGMAGDRDKYGRLLRYVFLSDGTLYNEELIRDGYGHEYTYQNQHYDYQARFQAAEIAAKRAQRGLWAPATCHGDTKRPIDL